MKSLITRSGRTPLTPAQHQQRVDAARARWAAAGLAASAAGATMFYVARRAQAAAHLGVALQAMAQQAPEVERSRTRLAELVLRERRVAAHIARSWPVPAMRAMQYQAARDALRSLRGNAWQNPHFGGAPADQGAWDQDIANLQHARSQLEYLKDARPAKAIKRAGRQYTIKAHTRDAADLHPKKSKAYKAADSAYRSAMREASEEARYLEGDAGSSPELEAAQARLMAAAGARKHVLANLRARRAKAVRSGDAAPEKIPVRPEAGKVHTAKGGKVRLDPGTFSQAQLGQFRDTLRWKLRTHMAGRAAAETARHGAAMGAQRAGFTPKLGFASRILLRSRGVPALLAVGAALAGGAAGLAAASGLHLRRHAYSTPAAVQSTPRPVDKLTKWIGDNALTKAAGDELDEDDETADHLDAAVRDAEPVVAKNLANAFRMWKDDATRNLFSPRERALLTTVHTDLDRATAPLDTVMERAIAAPISGVAHVNGEPHEILLATDVRSPKPQQYIADYRKSRIAELTKDQRNTIRDILIEQATAGTSPDKMARQIREVIGLTREQASHVQNYRAELETLDGNALERQLRDKRYDKVLQRALDSGTALKPGQIDKMVDAYHRKYLAFRAITISRTESVGAANNGHVAAVRSFLQDHPDYTVIKTWNAKLDSKTRPDHAALHGTAVIGIDTPFKCESGDRIAWPHQPGAPARQCVNCRCFPEMRLVPRVLAASLGPKSVRPLSETVADAPVL